MVDILHISGMWGTPAISEQWVNFFRAHGFACHVPRLPHHKSDLTPDELERLGHTGIMDYADDVQAYIQKNLEKPPIIIGHSMGGLLAQILAARGLAKEIILLAPASPAGIFALKPSVIRSFWSILTTWGFWRKPHKQSFQEFVYSMGGRLSLEERHEIYNQLVHESGRAAFQIGFWPLYWAVKWICFGWVFGFQIPTEVNPKQVTCPVLVHIGEEDRITPQSVGEQVAKRYDVTPIHWAHHAHWLIGETGWEEIAQHCLEWIHAQELPHKPLY